MDIAWHKTRGCVFNSQTNWQAIGYICIGGYAWTLGAASKCHRHNAITDDAIGDG